MSLDPKIKEQITSLAVVAGQDFVTDFADLLDSSKTDRALELLREVSDLKVEALAAAPADKRLYAEMIEDKLGTMAHVAATEGLVTSKQIGEMFARAARTMLTGFGIVARELIKVSLKAAVSGIAGDALGAVGESLADTAIDAVTDAISPD